MTIERVVPTFGFILTGSALLVAFAGCSSGTQWDSQTAMGSGSSTEDFQMTSTSTGFYCEQDAQFWIDGEDEGQGSLSQVTFASEGADFDPEVDPTGSFLIYSSTQHSTQSDIYRKQVDGKTITRLTFDSADDAMPTFSPDGKWVAFASNRSGNWDIWMMPVGGGAATQMTSDSDHELHPSFSADGTELTYCRRNSRSNHWEIWSYSINSPGVRTYVCDGLFPQWSPDPVAPKLLFQKARQRGSQFFSIWTVQYAEGTCSNPTEIVSASDAAIMHPSWSPDGKLICYCQVASPQANSGAWPMQAEVWMVSVDGSGQAPLTTGNFRNMQPNWSQDGRIYFVSDRGGEDVIWSIPAASAGGQVPMQTIVDATEPLPGE
jgi:TolB protein